MKIKLKESIYIRPNSKTEITHMPVIPVFLTYKHAQGKAIECRIDTGADVNLFPLEYAKVFFNFNDSRIKKGREINLGGISGIEKKAYGFKCSIHHPSFKISDVFIYFIENQPYPLLGLKGFIDKFQSITIHGKEKTLELIK